MTSTVKNIAPVLRQVQRPKTNPNNKFVSVTPVLLRHFRAGGLSVLASAIVERALAGDFFTARKLGFAQQIVSG